MPKRKDDGRVILSSLEVDLLKVLKGEKDGIYGLKILEKVNNARSKVGGLSLLHASSLYTTLKRLEQAKLIEGGFQEKVSEKKYAPRRKYYRILEDGQIAITRTEAYRKLLDNNEIESSDLGELT